MLRWELIPNDWHGYEYNFTFPPKKDTGMLYTDRGRVHTTEKGLKTHVVYTEVIQSQHHCDASSHRSWKDLGMILLCGFQGKQDPAGLLI